MLSARQYQYSMPVCLWVLRLTSCSLRSSLLKLSSSSLVRTSGMSCHSENAEPRDERKELDGDRLLGDGVSPVRSSSVPGSAPCWRWISRLMATSLYSWYRMAGKEAERERRRQKRRERHIERDRREKQRLANKMRERGGNETERDRSEKTSEMVSSWTKGSKIN